MKISCFAPVVGVVCLSSSGLHAGDPVRLELEQLDRVTAGGSFSFSFEKAVFASSFEQVVGQVELSGSLLQSTADVQGSFVQTGDETDVKIETSTFAGALKAPTIGFEGSANIVQANSFSFIAFETD